MIDPPPARSRAGTPALQPRKTPVRLIAIVRSQVSSDVSTASPSAGSMMPALLNSTSSRPNVSSASSTMAWQSSLLATSAVTQIAVPGRSASISSTVSRHAFSLMSTATIRAPSAENSRQVSRPIPPPAPVISATLSASRSLISRSPFHRLPTRCRSRHPRVHRREFVVAGRLRRSIPGAIARRTASGVRAVRPLRLFHRERERRR